MASAFRGADKRKLKEAAPRIHGGPQLPSRMGEAGGPAILTTTATYPDPRHQIEMSKLVHTGGTIELPMCCRSEPKCWQKGRDRLPAMW